jgi:signal transduction histidine kinase
MSTFPAGAKLVDFLTSLPCVIYESTADLTVTMISPNVFDLIGIQPESLKGNRSLLQERLHVEDRQRVMTRLDQLALTEAASERHRIINDRGLPVWVLHSFRKLGKSDDTHLRGCLIPLPIEIAAPSPDIGAISQFVHKIGNHFQLINLLIGSLGRNELLKGEINALQETVDRAVEFTRSFSQFTQIAANQVTLNLAAVVDLVIRDAEPLFEEKKVIFKALVHDSLNGVLICGDSFLLEIALGSILQNALEATKSGDEVILEGKANTAQGCIATISIVDTGCGMEEQLLENATAPFFSSKPDRNGLGLSMASRVVNMHGGLLTITSEAGQGTRVDISLPLKMSAENPER